MLYKHKNDGHSEVFLLNKLPKNHQSFLSGEGDAFQLAGDILVALAGKVHLELVRGELMKVSWYCFEFRPTNLGGGFKYFHFHPYSGK